MARNTPQKLIFVSAIKGGTERLKSGSNSLRWLCFKRGSGGYKSLGLFLIAFSLFSSLIFGVWLPVYAHKFGEFPGKGSKETWKKANYYAMEGQKARKEKKYDEAIPLYGKAIQIYPHDGDYYFGRGLAYEARRQNGDLQNAESEYRRAVSLCPQEWQVWECLGHVLYEKGQKAQCQPMFLKAISCGPPEQSKARIRKNIETVKMEIEKEGN